ncbi:cytochrome P450 71A25 [Morus notabilis]|uniref:cytochrome P450 71A25 n=1 Tax=Morus notabilis TaxID=981085 RepID=UPI000CED3911|nr:cytochrome P450 71A25 [Morus notabilis]
MLKTLLQDNFSNPSSLITIVLGIIFPVILYKLWSSNKSSSTNNKNLPPSPRSIPIIGNLHQLGPYPHRTLRDLSRRHGDDLMLLRLGSVPVLVVSSSDTAREVMKTHDLAFCDRPRMASSEKLLYDFKDVSSAPYGEYWRQMRSTCVLHLLSNARVKSFRGVREEETKLMADKIHNSCSSSSAVNLSELFAGLTNDVVCRVALGRKYSDDGESGREFKELLGGVGELLGIFNVGDYIPMLAWLSHVNGLYGRMDKVAKDFDEFLEKVVEEHKEHVDDLNEDRHKDNLVDILLWIQKENLLGFPIDRTCIKALILDMFAAGTDTTYTVLEWAMTELLRHPKAMKKLQNEVRTIVGHKTGVTEDDLEKMPYLKAVFKETLRLHPPVPLLVPRVSRKDVKIKGYDVVAGCQVFINAWAIGRDPRTWDNVEKFEPERFFNSVVDYKGQDFALIPFGAGRRGCPGILFVMAVNEIALANVVHNFDWQLPDGARGEDLDMTETSGLTVHRKFPLMALPKLLTKSTVI